MRALADYVHSKGLKFGLYTARGSGTCQSRPGSLNHEYIDAATYCSWNLDYIKIDRCKGAQDMNTSWSRFHEGLTKCFEETGREIVQSVESCDSPDTCGQWVSKVANLWRTGGDVQNYWGSVMSNIHKNDIMADVATPGHFNDPDMLQVGNVGLTPIEQRSHFSLWCITAAPLLAGTDIEHASELSLLALGPFLKFFPMAARRLCKNCLTACELQWNIVR
jgi:alpha-galactosidase